MNKKQHFSKLHHSLGLKYRLESKCVQYIRQAMIGEGIGKELLQYRIEKAIDRRVDALESLNKTKLQQNPQLREDYESTLRNIRSLKRLLRFMQGCATDQLEDILQKSEFDKS